MYVTVYQCVASLASDVRRYGQEYVIIGREREGVLLHILQCKRFVDN